MAAILCFGDSLTWGSNPEAGGARHARPDRWPQVLGDALGGAHDVITDGLRGRTTAYDEALADCDRNGARLLPTALYAHAPLDLVILMLGSNDLKPHVCGTAVGALQGMRRCVEIVRQHAPRLPGHRAPEVLIVAPPAIRDASDPFYREMFGGAPAESRRLPGLYAALATEMAAGFLDAGRVATAHAKDGVHLDAANTRALGEALVSQVRALLEQRGAA